MISDPVLKAHQVFPPFPAGFGQAAGSQNTFTPRQLAIDRALFPPMFNLSGKLSPVSIRDQMVRGQLLAERAYEEEIINSDYPLLIIGAGAAGITTAMTSYLRRYCVPTVVESEADPFSLQARCTSRWISPTQYDWPVEHWNGAAYPVSTGWRPLPWNGDRSHSIAAFWKASLTASRMHVDYSSRVRNAWPIPRALGKHPMAWAAEYWCGGAWRTRQFGAIVVAIGFGEERYKFTASHGGVNYTSRPFWSDDMLENSSYGLFNEPSILISGSGDGGLQDFLRIATNCKSAHQIMKGLTLPGVVAETLQDEEDWAGRGYHWGANERHDHSVLHRLHEKHKGMVEVALNDPAVVLSLRGIVRSKPPKIRLVHGCTHFAGAYPLNRFLTLLIARFIEKELMMASPLVSGYRLHKIQGHPGCLGHFSSCEDHDHQVLLELNPDCTSPAAGVPSANPAAWPKSFNLIIIRHGIDFQPVTQTLKIPFIDLPRQTMPYDYPQ